MVTGTAAAVVYAFTTFVTVSDFNELNYTIIKREIREIRKELSIESDPDMVEYLEEDLDELIDRLCRIAPKDRECK